MRDTFLDVASQGPLQQTPDRPWGPAHRAVPQNGQSRSPARFPWRRHGRQNKDFQARLRNGGPTTCCGTQWQQKFGLCQNRAEQQGKQPDMTCERAEFPRQLELEPFTQGIDQALSSLKLHELTQ